MRFSNSGSIASGVTSRPVKPVPPVVMTTSTPGSAIHVSTMSRIASTSSVHDLARGETVSGGGEPVLQGGAGFVVIQRARVGNGQHRDVERDERGRLLGCTLHYRLLAPKVLQACSVPC